MEERPKEQTQIQDIDDFIFGEEDWYPSER